MDLAGARMLGMRGGVSWPLSPVPLPLIPSLRPALEHSRCRVGDSEEEGSPGSARNGTDGFWS
jgi:hypothetical protein